MALPVCAAAASASRSSIDACATQSADVGKVAGSVDPASRLTLPAACRCREPSMAPTSVPFLTLAGVTSAACPRFIKAPSKQEGS